MKIVVIGPTYPYSGGISHYNTTLCKNLLKKHDVVVISYKRQYPSFLYPGRNQIDRSNVKLKIDAEYILDTINPITWIKAFLRIKQMNPDLLIFHWVTPFMALMFSTIAFLVRKLTKTKVLCICHNVLPHERRAFDTFLTKLTFKNIDFFIVQSREDYNNLRSIIPKPNVRQTAHPIYDIFKFNEISKDEAKMKLGMDPKTKVILFFGYVREYKGLIYLIRAMPKVLEKLDAVLLIVGEFWDDKNKYLEEINKLSVAKHVIIFDRYVPNEEVGLYFSAADVVVLPYISATQSGVVQIAYAFNKPVITTDVGGLPDVVKNGRTGLIVRAKDSKELARAIIYYFENNKEKEFVRNIEREKERYSWDRIVRIIEEFGEML